VTEEWHMPLEPELLFWILGMMPITVCSFTKGNLIYLLRKQYSLVMAVIETSIEINAPTEKVWDLVSDIDNEPKFWKGTLQVRNISKEGNVVNREITIAFRDQKCQQEVTLYPKEKIVAVFTKGIISGSKTVNLIPQDKQTILEAKWNVKLTGIMGIFTGMVTKHIRNGTDLALQSIKEELER
jgi:ribosome-associated toxin RatA of RatAB toxin-antitoxin module